MKNYSRLSGLVVTAFIMVNVMSCMNEDSVVQELVQEVNPPESLQNELFTTGIAIGEMYGKPGFRELVYSEVDKKFDGDFNVLVTNLVRNYPENDLLKSGKMAGATEYFRKTGRHPQIYIPFYEELNRKKKLGKQDPVFLIYSDENESGEYEGYSIDRNGGLTKLGYLIDENFAMENEVWVISLNERTDPQGNVVYENPVRESILRCAGEENSTGQTENGVLKSACGCASPPKTPTNLKVMPYKPYSLSISWLGEVNNYYKIYREVDHSGTIQEISTVNYKNCIYNDNFLTVGCHYNYMIQAFTSEDCFSGLTLSEGARASWRTDCAYELLSRIYLTDRCWNWCCSWPEGDIELVYRIVKYNKAEKQIEYPKNNLPQKTKGEQKGKWCTYNTQLFRWDIESYAYNYLLFIYEDDGGNDSGMSVKLSAKFATSDDLTINIDVAFSIDDRDEDLGWIEIHHYDQVQNEYKLSPRKGSALLKVSQSF